MPWSAMKTIPALEGKPREQRELFAEVANEALSKGRSEEESIFAGLSAVNTKFKPKSIKKQEQQIPWHLKAVLEAPKQPLEHVSEVTASRPTLLIKNAITSDPSRSLVSADFDKDDRLVLIFDDGNKIITRPIDIKSYVEQYVSVKVGDTTSGGTGGLTNPVDYIEFNTANDTVPSVGVLSWNATEGTLNVGLSGGNVTLQIGQETVLKIVNKTGAVLNESDYKVVRIRTVSEGGAQGQRLAVKLAQADTTMRSDTTIGIVTETIANNQEGFITTSGQVHNINTTGSLQGETWADGDILYLSGNIAGGLTNIKPIAPMHVVVVGYVEYAHTVHGKILVKVTNGFQINDLHNVKIESVVNDDVLTWDSSSALWINKPIPSIGNIEGGNAFSVYPVFNLDGGGA